MSTVQSGCVCPIDPHTVLINEVPGLKRWLNNNTELISLFVHSQRCYDDEWNLCILPFVVSSRRPGDGEEIDDVGKISERHRT